MYTMVTMMATTPNFTPESSQRRIFEDRVV